jgi:murein DD-endopeptidase MepM/ murein hydrolase activator NlpD
MRRRLLPLAALLLLAVPSPASADTGGTAAPTGTAPAAGTSTGGSAFDAAPLLRARRFSLTPHRIVRGAPMTLSWRVDGRARRARLQVLLRRGGHTVATLRLGRRRTNRTGRFSWKPNLAPGSYVARLRASAVQARHVARVSSASSVRVSAPPGPTPTPPATPAPASPSGVFPVRGAYGFGGADARFGAARAGHVHEGQDIVTAEGTPIVSPRAGSVYFVSYQAGGAGYYVVVRGDDGRDYVFMHLQAGSTLVAKGELVRAGQQLGRAGSTGESSGPHLHFEIWPHGWYAAGSRPIDPLPDLLAWAGPGAPSPG